MPETQTHSELRQAPLRRQVGLLAPVFMLPGQHGIGDTSSVMEAIDFCGARGIGALQILPITRTGGDNSPYNGLHSIALDPMYLHLTPDLIPGMTEEDESFINAEQLSPVLNTDRINYRIAKALKDNVLWRSFCRWLSREGSDSHSHPYADYIRFVEANSWLRTYAFFQVLHNQHQGGKPYRLWNGCTSHFEAEHWLAETTNLTRENIERKILFEMYVQWVADTQWRAVKDYATSKNVQIIGDLPFGVSSASADLWGEDRRLFLPGWYAGAPPESAFTAGEFVRRFGQNWGLAVPNWEAHRAQGYAWWKNRLRGLSRYCHGFRIDHVLGFFRLYSFPWDPSYNDEVLRMSEMELATLTHGQLPQFLPRGDSTAEDREKNRANGHEILSVVLQESKQLEVFVIAEDLGGTVPDYVRQTLRELNIPGYILPQYFRKADESYVPASQYVSNSVACWGTHDNAPLTIFYKEMVARWHHHEHGHAGWLEMRRLMQFIGMDPEHPPKSYSGDLHDALHRALLTASSDLVVFTLPSLLGIDLVLNEPGTCGDGCWTGRLTEPLSTCCDRASYLKYFLQGLPCEIDKNGRNPK